MSNVVDKSKESKPICGAEEYFVVEKFGCKIGIVALAEEAMLEQLSHEVDAHRLEHLDCSEKFQELSQKLRGELGCHFVISLNRMRMMDDIVFAKE